MQNRIIGSHLSNWNSAGRLEAIPANHSKKIIDKYSQVIGSIASETFQQLPVSDDGHRKLERIAALIFCNDRFSDRASSVVIAGFGTKQAFPALSSYTVEFKMLGKTKYRLDRERLVDRQKSAMIIPFAYREMVDSFMEGVNPQYRHFIEGYLSELFKSIPSRIVRTIKGASGKEKKEMSERLTKSFGKIYDEFMHTMEDYSREVHVEPVLGVVDTLPKEELAEMAEALVSLTSFKQKMSLDEQTVGGPIDVAVISKGDGFIWIKRKHYFKAEQNPHYFK